MNEEYLICQYSGLPSLAFYKQEQDKKSTLKESSTKKKEFNDADIDRIIQMAWEDRTPLEAIYFQFGLREKDVIEFMRQNSKPSSFRMWRKRMNARSTKHVSLRDKDISRFKCSRQRETGNKISKR